MLEDDHGDVLRKAMVGRGLDLHDLTRAAELTEDEVRRLLAGEFAQEAARACARALGLDVEKLARHPRYHPQALTLEGVIQLELPFGDYGVNAWWLSDAEVSVLFDAGLEAFDLMAALPATPDAAFITHAHRDHVGGLPRLLSDGVTCHGAEIGGLQPVSDGREWICGSLKVRACDLSGHAMPMHGYHIHGLAKPVLVVGDALFAGSMGKCPDPERYRHALERLHMVLDPLPDETVLLPGHGPATTLGEERAANPFL